MRIAKRGLTFDDVLLVPAFSEVVPREVRLTTQVAGLTLHVPLLSSAMDTVTTAPMAVVLAQLGGIGVVHKNMSHAAQADAIRAVKQGEVRRGSAVDASGRLLVAAAIGVGAGTDERAAALLEAGVDLLVIDTAHGHSKGVIDKVRELRARYTNAAIMAGNVGTAAAALALVDAGANAIKIGIGPGSICTTRIVAGVGVPQITAVMDVAEAVGTTISVIADGGIRYSGDVAKAIAAGAHAVMLGGLFAGSEEAPGDTIVIGERRYKSYRGMGSLGAMQDGSSDRYFQEGEKSTDKLVPEGVEARVPYKGPVAAIVHQLLGGLRASMGYVGCGTIETMRTEPSFIEITAAGMHESHVHDVEITSEAPNYRK